MLWLDVWRCSQQAHLVLANAAHLLLHLVQEPHVHILRSVAHWLRVLGNHTQTVPKERHNESLAIQKASAQ